MAKSKKAASENESKAPAAGSGAGKKPAAKKQAKAEKPAAVASSAPMIDTGLAAANAARMLTAASKKSGEQPVSKSGGLIDQLKAELNKPAGNSMANVLDKTAGPTSKRPGLPFGQQKQVGHNQTFGADVNRSYVPRRTGGG